MGKFRLGLETMSPYFKKKRDQRPGVEASARDCGPLHVSTMDRDLHIDLPRHFIRADEVICGLHLQSGFHAASNSKGIGSIRIRRKRWVLACRRSRAYLHRGKTAPQPDCHFASRNATPDLFSDGARATGGSEYV